ncbi:MAG: hypothetical protein ABIS36_02580 [Chryseolinea sp.]
MRNTRIARLLYFLLLIVVTASCTTNEPESKQIQPAYTDVAFEQEFSIKYTLSTSGITLRKVYSDRDGVIEVLGSSGLLKTFAGDFLYPGTLVPDKTYRPIADKKINGLTIYEQHFVYADDKAVLSNAWAGYLFAKHKLSKANILTGGKDFAFLISDGKGVQFLKDSTIAWEGTSTATVKNVVFDSKRNLFWLLTDNGISIFSPEKKELALAYPTEQLTAIAFDKDDTELVVGTHNGYFLLDPETKKQKGEIQQKLPATDITAISNIEGNLWFGTTSGAFVKNIDDKFKYYASKRWLPSDNVVMVSSGPDHSILVLTDNGLGQICKKSMTLYDKAMYYEQQVRARHIRHGFNATLGFMTDGSLSTGSLEDSDNDGLWTSMYLGGEVFRYAVTKSPDALQNIREAMEAMERLYTINHIKGFPSRSFERRGYKYDDEPWRRTRHPEWDWKSTTSSDEAIGHIFIFATIAELVDDDKLKKSAITLIDSLMQHTLDNNLYMVDWNGKPTTWGRWNPEYVNARPKGTGDRKINSSNFIAMLQTAYHFTKKEAYKEKALELMTKYGYYENLMRPMKQIGKAADDADDWSKMLSESWNHSDDEMYFIGYWGLYRYALNDTLKTKFKEAIIDHWESERPEKEGAWNIFTAITGTSDFDLNEAVWYLKEFPLDLIHWKVINSKRKDIEMIEPNFRGQSTNEVLPAGELPVSRHNANRFDLDGGDDGKSEYSAGDIWLLPYWMGRYLNVISAPVDDKHKSISKE